MASKRLTEVSIRALPIPERGQKTYWDGSLAGFGVRVSQGGTKSFVLVSGATRKRTTIGKFGVIGLAEARQAAKRLLAKNTLGHSQVIPVNFDEAKAEYLELCAGKNRSRTVYDYTRILNRHFKLGRTPLSQISTQDIVNRLNKLTGTPREHAYALTVIKSFFRWAGGQRYIEANPVAGLSAPSSPSSREHVLSDDELKEVYRHALEYGGALGAIVRLLILTGQRRSEIAGLRWEWVEGDTVTLPTNKTKNKRVHRFPLSQRAMSILKEQPQLSEWVFPAAKRVVRGRPTTFYNSWSKGKKDFDSELEGVQPYTFHDLRRTFSTKLAELGTPIQVTEKLLNHSSGAVRGVAAVYNRYSYAKEMREAVERLAEVL